MRRDRWQRHSLLIGFCVLVFLILWAHLWQLAEIPRGLYVDETSIGLNAARIAQSGVDEHGESWPIFFTAFGEYKNPLYIYGASLIFWLTGPSVLGLRLTSALFFFVFLAGLGALSWQLFRRPLPVVFVVATAAFLPWFFPISRIAFESVSQLSVTVLALLCLYLSHYRARSRNAQWVFAALAGALFAASVYTYSTSRLLAFASLGIWALLYFREARERVIAGAVGFAAGLIPYLVFSLTHPGALTARFNTISYLPDPNLSASEKVLTFFANYLTHFTPDFLLLTGDTYLRHASGYGGTLFASVLVVSGIGIVTALAIRRERDQKFVYFLALLGLACPIPAALTSLDGGNAMRTLLLGLIFVLFVGYGVAFLERHYRVALYAFAALLVVETGAYLVDYFANYPARSLAWFETYDLEGTLETALAQEPEKIMVSPNAHQSATNLAFYEMTIANPNRIPITMTPSWPEAGDCLIYFLPADEGLLAVPAPPFRDLTPRDSIPQLRCY